MSIEDELCDGFSDASWLLGSVLYILCLGKTVVCVGRTTNVIARLIKHRAQGRIAFDRVYTKWVPRDLASAEEARLIRALRPTLNIASTPKAKRLTQAEIAEQARALRRSLRGAVERRI